MKKILGFLGYITLVALALVTGVGGGVMMAATPAPLEGGGKTATAGSPSADGGGIATTVTTDAGSPDLHVVDVDQLITKIRPKATPLSNIMRYCKTVKSSSNEYKYYSLGTRPNKTTAQAMTAQTSGASVTLLYNDSDMFDVDDTILVRGVKGYNADGTTQNAVEDLMLQVAAVESNGDVKVFAVNGKADANGRTIHLPAIAANTVLIRAGRAMTELDAQTSAFANVPTPETVYCQIFMMQVEESTVNKMRKTEVPFNFTDLEEDSIFDMRRGQEASLWFGVGKTMKHATKRGQQTWYTRGIWWQAGKDLELGVAYKGDLAITDDNLVDFEREIFTGEIGRAHV